MEIDGNIKHLFVINPKSFYRKTKQNQIVARIHQFFKNIGSSNYEIYVSHFPRDAVSFIPIFAAALPETTTLRVYAVGGDGILYDCLNGIMGLKNAELGAIPYGYTNNFIQGFEKSDRVLFKQLSNQYNAPAVPMDVMRCGNNYALSYCIIGLEAEAVRQAEKLREQMIKSNPLNKWLSRNFYTLLYFIGGLSASSDKLLYNQRYEVTVDGEQFHGNYQGLSIFNGAYYGGHLHPISSAMPNDGILDMFNIKIPGPFITYCIYPFYESGHYKMFPLNFSLRQGKKIVIHSDDIILISMDGIVFYEPELEIELLPGALKFIDASIHGYKGVRR